MPQPAAWAILAALALLIWYLVEWDQARSSGRSLPPSRHPALLLLTSLRLLARARQLLLPLIAFWLLSGLVYWGVQRPIMMRNYFAPLPPRSASAPGRAPQQPAFDRQTGRVAAPEEQSLGQLAAKGWEQFRTLSGNLPLTVLYGTIPRLSAVGHIFWSGYLTLLVYLALLLCLAWLIRHRPFWLGNVSARQLWLALIFGLLPLGMLLFAAFPQLGQVVGRAFFLVMAANGLSMVVLYGLVAHLLLQVAQRRRHLSLTAALRGILHGVAPLAWLVAIVVLAPGVLQALTEWLVPPRLADGVLILRWPNTHLPEVLSLAFLFVPWIILRDRAGTRRALKRNFALIADHAPDLAVFALRYVLIVYPLEYIHHMLNGFAVGLLPSAIGHLVGATIALVSLVTVALLYLELERRTPRPGAMQAAAPEQGMADAPPTSSQQYHPSGGDL